MNDILQIIANNKRKEVETLMRLSPLLNIFSDKLRLPPIHSMSGKLKNSSSGIIAEFKRRSPSKGEIAPMADVAQIIPEYLKGGASGSSILTDTRFFGGSINDLALARTLASDMPLLRKDFIISKYQIEETRILGASSILLIAAILSKDELENFNEYAHSLGMEALVEIHDVKELDKLTFNPDMLGVNNRNLSSFHTDVRHSSEMIKFLPKDTVLVAESGIKHPDDVKRLQDQGYLGFLIGETFMSTPNPGETLKKFIDEVRR